MRRKYFLFIFLFVFFYWHPHPLYAQRHDPSKIRSIYLSIDNIGSSRKIAELENLIRTTNANGIVIDFKDSNTPDLQYMKKLTDRFHAAGAYVIARIVTFQDSGYARKHPELAIRTSSGVFWQSGAKKWKRYWLDPASMTVQNYTIETAKNAVDCGFDEIQFDYIRFPTDGNMKDLHYPVFNPEKQSKGDTMEEFFRTMRHELKAYAPNVPLGIDLFGEVFVYGKERGIGQDLAGVAKYFDVLSPMAYPSHYRCGEFKVHDPNAHPYLVYSVTLKNGLQFLSGQKIIIRPWVQAFTLKSIYGCGPAIPYGPENVDQEIKAGTDLGINGFMLWNVGNNFSKEIFK